MADIELVIRIPEEEYKCVQITGCIGNKTCISNAIYNGTPLPKGHGRLIDADDVKSYFSDREGDDFTAFYFYDAVESVPTIIEADNENPLDEYSPMVEEMKQMMQGNTDEKIATLTECEESYAKGYEDGHKAGHLEGCRDEYEAMASYLRSVLEELRP